MTKRRNRKQDAHARIGMWMPQRLDAELTGSGPRLTTKLVWTPPLLNAESVGGYQVERRCWWPGADSITEILNTEPVRKHVFCDESARADMINEYRVRAVHRRFPAMIGPWSFPAAVYGFAYIRYQEMVRELKALGEMCPEICRIIDAGPAAIKPCRIWCAVLGTDTGDSPDRPGVFLAGNVHGGEIEGGDVCMSLVRELVQRWRDGDAVYRNMLERVQIRIIPIYNPGARLSYEKGFPGGIRKTGQARKLQPPSDPLHIAHCWNADTSAGWDPNRTFDAGWTYVGLRKSGVYAGKHPFAAPETRALVKMARALRPQISVNYHGPCGYPLLPGNWPDGSVPVERPLHMAIGREFARRSNPIFANDIPDESPQPSMALGGVAQNWFYKEFYGGHLLPEGFCGQVPGDNRLIPVAGSKAIEELAKSNMDALLWMAERVNGAGLQIHVYDELGRPVAADVEVIGHMDPNCLPQKTDSRHGGYRRILFQGMYTVKISDARFRTKTIKHIRVNGGTPTVLTIRLERIS